MRRTSLSRPVPLAVDDGLIREDRMFLDYGSGRGDDLLRLHRMGIAVCNSKPARLSTSPDSSGLAEDRPEYDSVCLSTLLRSCGLNPHARIPRIGCPSTSASRKSRPPKR